MTTEELAREAFGVYKRSLAEARRQDLVQPWDMITPAMREAFTESVRFILKAVHEDEIKAKRDASHTAFPVGAETPPYVNRASDEKEELDTVFVELELGTAYHSAKRVQELRDNGYRIAATAGDWILMVRK